MHLQLEARKRLYPHVPTLLYDDQSAKRDELRSLCELYGVEFQTSENHGGHTTGALTAFIAGMEWAKKHKFDLLACVPRRWIWLIDWTPSLIDLAEQSQYATIASYGPEDPPMWWGVFNFKFEGAAF